MHQAARIAFAVASVFMLICAHIPLTSSTPLSSVRKRSVSDDRLTAQALEDAIHALRGSQLQHPDTSLTILDDIYASMTGQAPVKRSWAWPKRRFDVGYGNRYRAASSVGSKLMALKQAADWNGPGKKRRSADNQ